jgi:hypothetical protein
LGLCPFHCGDDFVDDVYEVQIFLIEPKAERCAGAAAKFLFALGFLGGALRAVLESGAGDLRCAAFWAMVVVVEIDDLAECRSQPFVLRTESLERVVLPTFG